MLAPIRCLYQFSVNKRGIGDGILSVTKHCIAMVLCLRPLGVNYWLAFAATCGCCAEQFGMWGNLLETLLAVALGNQGV